MRSEQAGTRRLGSIRRGRKFQTDLCDRLRLEYCNHSQSRLDRPLLQRLSRSDYSDILIYRPPAMPRSSRSGVPFSSAKHSKSATAKSAIKPTRGRAVDAKSGPLQAADNDTKSSKNASRRKERPARNEQDLDGLNVYDYIPAPVKNSRTSGSRFELSREEAQLAGNKRRTGVKLDDDSDNGGSDGDDDMAGRIRRAALTIAGDDPLELDDDDDEEIDSDDAWNSGSDEERWGSSFASWKKKASKKMPVERAVQQVNTITCSSESPLTSGDVV